MSDLIPQIICGVLGLLGGATIGSLVTLKIVRSQTTSGSSRAVTQSNVRTGRDNIIGDVTDRHP